MKHFTRDEVVELLDNDVPCLEEKILYIRGGAAQLFQEGLVREGLADSIEITSNKTKFDYF